MTVSIALVGAGRMGKAHETALTAIPDARIVGVADVQEAAARDMAARHNAEWDKDYQALLQLLKPDAVYFCTPATEHRSQVEFAASLGINVFVEKPVATTVTDALAIADAVETAGILCSVGYQWRYNPATEIAREALADLPVSLMSGWWYWTIPFVPWIRNRRFGGGQIFDQATHIIDVMRSFGGEIETVHARYGKNVFSEEELPNWDSCIVSFEFTNGALGNLHTTYATFPGIPDSNGMDLVARELLVRLQLGKVTIFRPGTEPNTSVTASDWSIDQQFIDSVATNDPGKILATARESASSIAVSLAATHSALTRSTITMSDFIANPPPDSELFPNAVPQFQ